MRAYLEPDDPVPHEMEEGVQGEGGEEGQTGPRAGQVLREGRGRGEGKRGEIEEGSGGWVSGLGEWVSGT